jgi:hypothetical protein
VLPRKQRRGDVAKGTASTALVAMDRIGCEPLAHGAMPNRAAPLSERHRLGVFGCLYPETARERRLPVVTSDPGMRQLADRLSIALSAAEDAG